MQIAHRSVRRWGAAPVVGLVALALLAAGCGKENDVDAATHEEPNAVAFEQAAHAWLAQQPKDDVVFNAQYKFEDYGLSADIALALVETGEQERAHEIGQAVTENAKAYLAPGFGTKVSAGAAAKLALVAQHVTEEPVMWGNRDVLELLESRVTASGPSAGRVTDQIDPTEKNAADYANTIVQSLAVEALHDVETPRAESATDFLLQQQCTDGYFRVFFTGDPAATDQSCDGDKAAKPDVDATAYAARALRYSDHPEAPDAANKAVEWLVEQQADDGSFEAGQPSAPNSNSTGLAGDVLGDAGEGDAAAAAATWVAEHQIACGPEAGAIAYDDDALRSGKVTPKNEGVFQLATVQAVEVLDELPTDFEQKEC